MDFHLSNSIRFNVCLVKTISVWICGFCQLINDKNFPRLPTVSQCPGSEQMSPAARQDRAGDYQEALADFHGITTMMMTKGRQKRQILEIPAFNTFLNFQAGVSSAAGFQSWLFVDFKSKGNFIWRVKFDIVFGQIRRRQIKMNYINIETFLINYSPWLRNYSSRTALSSARLH